MTESKPKRMSMRDCCEDAAGWLAYHWLTGAERILADGREPAKLSNLRYEWAIDWVPEYVYARGSRYKASAEAGSVTLSANNALDAQENKHRAALALCAKLKWKGRLLCGGAANGVECYVFDTTLRQPVDAFVDEFDHRFTLQNGDLHRASI